MLMPPEQMQPRRRPLIGRRGLRWLAGALLVLAATALAVASVGGTATPRKAASHLKASSRCAGMPPKAVASLRWRPSRAGRQRVDVTVLKDGFATRRFDSSSRLGRTRNHVTWRRVKGEARHYWRVLTAVNHRWYRSATGSFAGPGCVGTDLQPQRP